MSSIDAAAWDALDHGPSPFWRSGFLRALEASGSVGPESGWIPVYLLAERVDGPEPELIGAVAAFVKTNSYGEYIFDWAWAGAAERAGIPYYPKMVVAAPVTPATGRRILVAPGWDPEPIRTALIDATRELAEELGVSSLHWLFCTEEERAALTAAEHLPRASYQFHWQNRGYGDFDDFLASLKSRKRKQLRKERRRALELVDAVEFVSGGELSAEDLESMDRFYRTTVWEHGGFDYLRPGFFSHLVAELPDELLFARARSGGATVAGAIFLETADALYGRYWGCDRQEEYLHFEVAYYAGIERCIARGTPLFEAGAQGEHKLLRGFEPAPTYSAHWIRHPGLREAIASAVAEEARRVEARMAHLAEYGPYRADED